MSIIPSAIPRETFAEIHSDYLDALAWMASLGVQISQGRTSHYERVMRRWKDFYLEATIQEADDAFNDFLGTALELMDFVAIHKSLKAVPQAKLGNIVSVLSKGVNGPVQRTEETEKNSAARNFLFEAVVTGLTHDPDNGFESDFDAPTDTGFKVRGHHIFIECKRVSSQDKLEHHLRKAHRQLLGQLRTSKTPGRRGLIFVDVSALLVEANAPLSERNDAALKAHLARELQRFAAKQKTTLDKVHSSADSGTVSYLRNRNVLGTMLRLACMGISEDQKLLVRCSQWAFVPNMAARTSGLQLMEQFVRQAPERFAALFARATLR